MAEDSNGWVFDSLICFLHGPIWNAPLQTFIEEKCVIFDPNDQSGERKGEYKKIHNEYKQLVDFMLSSFMDELQISPEQFEVACLAGRKAVGPGTGLTFTQSLFQQIWAANDSKIFNRMMTQHNVELQLQALDMIQKHHRQAKKKLEDGEASTSVMANVEEVVPKTEVADEITKEELEQIAALDAEDEKKIIESIEKEFENQAAALPVDDVSEKTSPEDVVNEKLNRLNLMFENENQIDSEDIKARQEYLRAQRDKILAIKKKARAHQLNETVKKRGRPTSAQAAQKILQSDGKIPGDLQSRETGTSLQLRKTLAKRLRDEVVDTEK